MNKMAAKSTIATDSPDTGDIMLLAASEALDSNRIRRLVERWGQSGCGSSPPPLRRLEWGLKFLLRFSAGNNALDIMESDDPVKVVERLNWISYVNDPHHPVLTLDELGSITRRFIAFLERQRTSLIETGYPRTRFDTSPWHDWRLTDLYRTKIPQSVTFSPSGKGQAHGQCAGFLEYAWSSTATSHPFPPDLWIGSPLCLNMPREYMATAFGPPPQERRASAEASVPYDVAPSMQGVTLNQAYAVHMERQYIFNAKLLVLQELCASLAGEDPDDVWDRCFAVLQGTLSHWQIKAFASLDRPKFLDAYGRQMPKGARPVGPITGGLSSLFNVILHFESELRVGPMRKIREALGDAVAMQPDGSKVFRLTAGWLSDEDVRRIDEAMTLSRRLSQEASQHDDDFVQRLRKDIERMTYSDVTTSARVPVTKKDATQAALDGYAQQIEVSTKGGIPIAGAVRQDRPAPMSDEYVFLREGDYWRLSYGGKSISVQDSLGMQYMWHLLLEPHQRIGVFTLSRLTSGEATDVKTRGEVDDGFDDDEGHSTRIRTPGDGIFHEADPEQARRARQRLREIEKDLNEARMNNDRETITSLQKEKRHLWDVYNATRPRQAHDGLAEELDNDLEKLRKAVRKCIATSIHNIREHHQPLAAHLGTSIRNGRMCVYEPDRKIEWVLT